MYETFDDWFADFTSHVRSMNYHGPVDKDSFEDNYNNDEDPAEVAEEFVKEMND